MDKGKVVPLRPDVPLASVEPELSLPEPEVRQAAVGVIVITLESITVHNVMRAMMDLHRYGVPESATMKINQRTKKLTALWQP